MYSSSPAVAKIVENTVEMKQKYYFKEQNISNYNLFHFHCKSEKLFQN